MPLKLTSYYRGEDIPDNLPGKNIFHSKELFLLYEAATGYDPLLIVATDNDKPIAKLLAVVRKHTHILPASWGKRCEVYGIGEYFTDDVNKEVVFGEMLEYFTQKALRHAYIIGFRNLEYALDGYKHFRTNGYFAVNWSRVRNSLHSVEKAEEWFRPARLRQVKKGLKNGAEAMEAQTIEEIQEFSQMLHKIYSFRARRYFPSMQFFKLVNEWLISKNLAKIYVIKYKGKIIGGSACLYSKDNAYLWFSGGMRSTYANQYPGILAVWIALKDAKERGCDHMEFMDVGLPFQKHGYRNFVLHFGGKQSSTRRWFRIRTGFLNNLLRKVYV